MARFSSFLKIKTSFLAPRLLVQRGWGGKLQVVFFNEYTTTYTAPAGKDASSIITGFIIIAWTAMSGGGLEYLIRAQSDRRDT